MTNLGSVLKNRDITLPTKVHIVKAMVFPVVMYKCESWIIKELDHEWQRITAFELWCWRRLLRVPWTVRRSNLSIRKEINPEYLLKGWNWSSNTLATWLEYSGHLFGKDPDAEKDWRRKEKGATEDEMRWLDSITDSVDMNPLNGHESEQTPGDSGGQGSLACHRPQAYKKSDTV